MQVRNPFVVGREIKYKKTFCNRESEIKKLMTRAKYSIKVLKEKAVRC
ncbi:MAG: hypothetical protein KIIPBIDF_01528 [Candidatus Methanoperedenaceae archaeon GB50]|nr:MAG: hypothetical protein KIIPBIDF_01528 [Candidatus Methanoperedenaceae archaeon GB50]